MSLESNRSIGVFDSGIGGLNVLNQLMARFPNEHFIYLGDNANVPYGEKSREELEKIIQRVLRFFEQQNCKAIFVACNTASHASQNLRSRIPIFRIIEPTAERALRENKFSSKKIGVIATNFTIEQKGYDAFLGEQMIGVKGSPFVPLIEGGKEKTDEARKVVHETLKDIKDKCDTIILGCTHFINIKEHILDFLGDVKVVDSTTSFAHLLEEFLKNNKLENADGSKKGATIMFSKEDDVNMKWFAHPYEKIHFIDL